MSMESTLKNEEINSAIKLIRGADRINLIAVGLSGIVAEYLKTALVRMGKTVIFDRDATLQAINSAVLRDDDLVIAISQSGKTKDVLDNVKIAKQHKVKVLAITNFINANIVRQSDVALVAPNMMGEQIEFLPMIGQFILVDMIINDLEKTDSKKAMRTSLISKELIDRL